MRSSFFVFWKKGASRPFFIQVVFVKLSFFFKVGGVGLQQVSKL